MPNNQNEPARAITFTIPETRLTRAILVSLGLRAEDWKPSLCIVTYSLQQCGFAMFLLTGWRQPADGRHFRKVGS